LVWLGLLGLLSLPLSSALQDFSVRQEMDAEFGRFKAGQLKRVAIAQGNPTLWSKVRLMYSSVSVVDNKARLDVVLNAPEDILDQSFMNKVNQQMLKRAKDFGLDDLDVNISVIPNRVYKFDNQKMD
jgi:ABC-type transport system involved in cytochrome c biogenesis ATPase subunit